MSHGRVKARLVLSRFYSIFSPSRVDANRRDRTFSSPISSFIVPEKSASQYRQVKAIFRQRNQSPYEAIREALRIVIPYNWRRRAVKLMRGRFGFKSLGDWARASFNHRTGASQSKGFGHGDPYQAITLLPYLNETDEAAVLNNRAFSVTKAKADVICFSIVDWSFRFQRPQQLMSQFADNGHRVFYLSISKFRSSHANPRFAISEIKDNLFEIQIAARSPLEISRSVVSGRDLELALESLDELRRAFNINEAIGYVMIPSWGKVAFKTRLRWGWRVIYDCMDEWNNFPGIGRRLLEKEKQLARDCDLLVVTSQKLFDKWSKDQYRIVLARNAADYDFYLRHCIPNDLLEGIKHPVIGFYGAIAEWFDVDLMVEVARLRPDYTFVLIGGVFDVDVSGLRVMPNVMLLGQQPYESMPQYLCHFDACIIPFKLNEITEAIDPVKLYEYLSGGKAVVSVDLPELEQYRDYVYIAEGAAGFATKLDQAMTDNSIELIESRKDLARQHTWSERYKAILSAFGEIVPSASIIIVTYNNQALTRLCLESVFRNTGYFNYEVIIVDNNSTDGTQQYLKELAGNRNDLKLILNDVNRGFAKANNQGIEISEGDYIILLNNDTIVPQGWLNRLLMHLKDPGIGMVGPVTNFAGNEAKIDVNYRTLVEMEKFAQDRIWEHYRMAADIDMLAMFCVAMRREVLEKVGPLDEQFGIGMFEDDDYSRRVKQAGYRVICAADAFIHHFGQAAFGKLIPSGDYDRLFSENRRKYEDKWGVEWMPHQNARLNFERH